MRIGAKLIRIKARELGMGVAISSPGDGYTRYTFETPDGGRDLSPVLKGRRQAWVWINGFIAGREGQHSVAGVTA